MSNLKAKAFRGASWTLIDQVSNTGISFVVGIILARLLTPAEFGILGMIAIIIAISQTVIDSGFSQGLIRKMDATNLDYNTVFYVNLSLGATMFVILYFCAPYIGNFFNEPLLVPISRVMGFILLFSAFGIIQRTLLIKNLDFRSQTVVAIIASIISGVIGIGMAYLGYGVWSLVAQQLSRQLLNTALLWIYNKWRPALEFSKASFMELFAFGSRLLVSGLIETVYRNVYYVIIGKYYSSAQLGQYNRAEQFSNLFSSNLTAVVQRVGYPLLSTIHNQDKRLRLAYQKLIKGTMLITFTCMLGLVAIAKPLIFVLIGVQWDKTIVYLQIICFAAMLYPLHALNLNILNVKGHSDLFLKLEVIKKFIGIGPILLGIFLGIEVMLWGSVAFSFIAFFINSFYSFRLVKYSSLEQIKDLMPSFLSALCIAVCMFVITLSGFPLWVILALQIVTGIAMFFAIHELIRLPEYLSIKEFVLTFVKLK